MKKALSVLFVLALIMGILGSFPISFAANADTPYSGGRGTEDDPYLISTSDDIKELYDNIENDPSLWLTKYYYKLTNDISTPYSISPLYITPGYEPNCFTKNGVGSYDGPKISIYEAWNYRGGSYFAFAGIEMTYYTVMSGLSDLVNPHYAFTDFFPGDNYLKKDCGTYRSAAFTGDLDGNGYTITLMNDSYLFGFIENGGVVKNLKLEGENASLAYCIDNRSEIKDCVINVTNVASAIDYISEYTGIYTDESVFETVAVMSSEEGFIVYNYGTVSGIVNNSKSIGNGISVPVVVNNEGCVKDCLDLEGGNAFEIVSKNILYYGAVSQRCVSLVEAQPKLDQNEYYTLEECIVAGSDPSAYIGFDFENVWIMKDGLPYLRTALERGTGDFDVNGAVNSVDTNLLRRYLSGSILNPEFIHPDGADMDNNGEINAVDSALLRRMLVG